MNAPAATVAISDNARAILALEEARYQATKEFAQIEAELLEVTGRLQHKRCATMEKIAALDDAILRIWNGGKA